MSSITAALPSAAVAWILNAVLAFTWAGAFVAYGFAFRQVGALQWSPGWFVQLGTNPLFLLAVGLSGCVSIMRFGMFSLLGIERSVMAGALSFVAVVLVAALVFREPISREHWIGMGFITLGVLFVIR